MLDVRPIHPLRIHPLRDRLVNEVHARPTVPLEAPQSASHLAVVTGEQAASENHAHLVLLCQRHGVVPPTADVKLPKARRVLEPLRTSGDTARALCYIGFSGTLFPSDRFLHVVRRETGKE
jgi:Protein of unknown function (DUF3422)